MEKGKQQPRPATFEAVRQIALALPGVEEGTSYGTPAFKVRGKLFIRLHQSGESIVVGIDEDERALRMKTDPDVYHITDHYINYPWVLVRLASVEPDELREVVEDSWRRIAPRRLLDEFEAAKAKKASR